MGDPRRLLWQSQRTFRAGKATKLEVVSLSCPLCGSGSRAPEQELPSRLLSGETGLHPSARGPHQLWALGWRAPASALKLESSRSNSCYLVGNAAS